MPVVVSGDDGRRELVRYAYLVDVLQRMSQHPASRVDELITRVWKDTLASNPLVSDLQRVCQ